MAAAQALRPRAIGHKPTAYVLEPGDRVAVRNDRVRVDPHHAEPRLLEIEAWNTAVASQQKLSVVNRDPIVLDQAPQKGDGQRRLVESRPRDNAGYVEPARIGAVTTRDVDSQSRRPRLHLVDLAEQLLESPLVATSPNPLGPAPSRRRRTLENRAEEVDPLVEGHPLKGVDAKSLEEAPRGVQVLLVGLRISQQRNHLRAEVECVCPF